ncbi:MAG: site-specific integrase [Bacteroides sp.]|nr:site-specific integrase [Bacteroides sp.]
MVSVKLRIKNVIGNLLFSKKTFATDEAVANYCEHSLFIYMEQMIAQYRLHGRHRTGETYSSTLSSFSKFRKNIDVMLEDIDADMLEEYASFLKRNNLSTNTISFYMKHLRAVYNRAVDNELIIDRCPFKRVSTSIERTPKRALPLKVIKRLKELDLSSNRSRRFARDMFLFSFYTRGMSFVDIAYLQKSNLRGDTLFYRRKKTNQPLTIHWESCMQEIWDAYRADASSPYLFSIIKDPKNHRKQYQNASSLINRHLKEIGKSLGLKQPLTMYCARHSWASIARDEGVPLSVISEGMGHDSEKTTQIYLASLKKGVIDSANRKILRLL